MGTSGLDGGKPRPRCGRTVGERVAGIAPGERPEASVAHVLAGTDASAGAPSPAAEPRNAVVNCADAGCGS